MCGRFVLDDDGTLVQAQFNLPEKPRLAPRYNIAPTQPVAAVFRRDDGRLLLDHFHWGLIPSWAKDSSMASRMINARSETAHEKPAFRSAFKRRRCLVPMSGFYEWQKRAGGQKQPMYIHGREEPILAAAGLWEIWHGPDGGEVPSVTIMTTRPNDLTRPIHDRMPVFLDRADYELWLDVAAPLPAVQALLKPFDPERMAAYPVSTYVNSPRNEGETCIAAISA